MGAGNQQLSPAQINAIARQAIKAQAVDMTQQIFGQVFTASGTQNLAVTTPTISVQPRNVGLIKGFWVKLSAVFTNGSAVQIDLSDFGPANLLSQIQFNDLNNNTRIQTTGWHINYVNSVKARRAFGSALVRSTGFDSPTLYGANWTQQISAPATIAAGGTGTVIMWYWVPLAYSNDDLRGAVYANVVNATMQLNLSPNPAPVVAAAADSTSAVYFGDVAGSVALARISSMTVTVYQNYLDQLPSGRGGVLLPITDLATIYELKNTALTAVVANNDFPIQYANFRDFLSTVVVYVSDSATGTRGVGADINYWALQSANFTNIWKLEPGLIALKNRNHMQVDFPPGTYYFGSREKPISTVQYGNMQLILNAITAGAGAYALAGFEDFALVQTLNMAGSLAAS
jgi:hypothetical protein